MGDKAETSEPIEIHVMEIEEVTQTKEVEGVENAEPEKVTTQKSLPEITVAVEIIQPEKTHRTEDTTDVVISVTPPAGKTKPPEAETKGEVVKAELVKVSNAKYAGK